MSDCITLLDGLAFGEAPRWHKGRLYFSDMHRGLVLALNADGTTEVICTVANQPSGLGWDPAGNLMIVSMKDRRLLRQDTNGSLVELADLSALALWHCNDMVVDRHGRAYVGNFGFDLDGGAVALYAGPGRADVWRPGCARACCSRPMRVRQCRACRRRRTACWSATSTTSAVG